MQVYWHYYTMISRTCSIFNKNGSYVHQKGCWNKIGVTGLSPVQAKYYPSLPLISPKPLGINTRGRIIPPLIPTLMVKDPWGDENPFPQSDVGCLTFNESGVSLTRLYIQVWYKMVYLFDLWLILSTYATYHHYIKSKYPAWYYCRGWSAAQDCAL